jgi:hypothetical protein
MNDIIKCINIYYILRNPFMVFFIINLLYMRLLYMYININTYHIYLIIQDE